MCMIPAILAQKGGEMLGMDVLGAQARKKKQDKKLQERGWERDDKLRAEDRDFETAQRAEDRAHDESLADKGFGRGGNWRGGNRNRNRRALSYGQGQSAYQRDRTA